MRVLARGTLGYAVVFDRDALYTIELEESFALVERDAATGLERRRIALGPAERDLPALAVADGVAWVGGADQQVRAIAIATGEVRATWPIGAAVTALALMPGGYVAIADAAGAVCLRRAADGALVQCAVVLDGAVARLERDGARLIASDDRAAVALTVPTLAVAAAALPAPAVRGHDALVDGAVVARFAGPARAVARRPDGAVAAVGWVRDLDDPSVVVVPAPPPR